MEIEPRWDVKALGDVVSFQRGFDLPYRTRATGGVPVVSSAGITGFHAAHMVLAPGVVTGRYGTIGEVFFLDRAFWPLNTTLFVNDFHGHEPLFIYYMLQRFDFKTFSGKSGVPGVNRNELHREGVSLPSSTAEQRAIAEALSDVDALLGGLDRLIAKKRDLKQAAMQQLLTGQTRLPGFTGEWEEKRLGEVAQLRMERVDPKQGEPFDFCVELEHIEQGTGRICGSSATTSSSSLKSVFRPRDVLFGKLRAYLRKYWFAERGGICSTEIWVLTPRSTLLTAEYLFHVVTEDRFIEAASTAYGTHMPRSDWNVVKNYEVQVPAPSEQTAIATVLSDMDAEIAALERRRDKTRALKQAMMQELLTGRTRLT